MGWERKRGKIEEFNRLLRGATRHQLHDTASGDLVDPADDALLHHARHRHAPAARRRQDADRHRRCTRSTSRGSIRALAARDRGLRHPAAAGQRHDVERRGLALRARLCRPHRRRSVHHRRVRHLSGPVRRRHLRRQGPLRRRRLHAALEAACRRTPCSRTTCSRACTRAPRWSPTSKSWTTIPPSVLAHARRQHRWVRGDWQILRVAAPVRADAPAASSATVCR